MTLALMGGVLEIVVGYQTFPIKFAICLKIFGFGWTKCPSRIFRNQSIILKLIVSTQRMLLSEQVHKCLIKIVVHLSIFYCLFQALVSNEVCCELLPKKSN